MGIDSITSSVSSSSSEIKSSEIVTTTSLSISKITSKSASKDVENVVRKESNDGNVCAVAFMSRGGNVDVSGVGSISVVGVAVAVVAGYNGNGVGVVVDWIRLKIIVLRSFSAVFPFLPVVI